MVDYRRSDKLAPNENRKRQRFLPYLHIMCLQVSDLDDVHTRHVVTRHHLAGSIDDTVIGK